MLNGIGGVDLGPDMLHGLYYADDIILFSENEIGLQNMLNIASSFAEKWGLKYNSTKSQVLVVGERLKERSWQLGDKKLNETNSYCYLGTIITRSLKDTEHINKHLMDKATKLESYMRYTLAKHMDIKRIVFADNMWRKAIQPSLSHAAGVWFSSAKSTSEKLSSIQYKMAKAALNIKCMPSAAATIAELGWIPFKDILDMNRISYYAYLLQMDDRRLPKIIYSQLLDLYQKQKPTAFGYVQNVKHILNENGCDFMFNDKELLHPDTVKKFNIAKYTDSFKQFIGEKSSLLHYRIVKQNTYICDYLKSDKGTFKGTQLKFKMRTGVSGIGEDTYRQKRSLGFCKCGDFESLKHLIFYCTFYTEARTKMFNDMKLLCGDDAFSILLQDPTVIMYAMLGDHDDLFSRLFIDFIQKAWSIRNHTLTL